MVWRRLGSETTFTQDHESDDFKNADAPLGASLEGAVFGRIPHRRAGAFVSRAGSVRPPAARPSSPIRSPQSPETAGVASAPPAPAASIRSGSPPPRRPPPRAG